MKLLIDDNVLIFSIKKTRKVRGNKAINVRIFDSKSTDNWEKEIVEKEKCVVEQADHMIFLTPIECYVNGSLSSLQSIETIFLNEVPSTRLPAQTLDIVLKFEPVDQFSLTEVIVEPLLKFFLFFLFNLV